MSPLNPARLRSCMERAQDNLMSEVASEAEQ